MAASTLFEKLWNDHVIETLGDGWTLLHIDRQLLHDLSGTKSLNALAQKNLPVHDPELAFATPDHAVSTAPGRTGLTFPAGGKLWTDLKNRSGQAGIRMFDVGEIGHGIVHVMAPELGIVQPGLTVICGDSHTCTNGALGALAFGVGTTELAHALATQTLLQRKPKTLRIRFTGTRPPGVSAKDVILYAVGRLGAGAGTGYAVEYAGNVIEEMTVEERMTVCNLSIELGAKAGMIAPDDKTFAYLKGRRFAPQGELWNQGLAHWKTLKTDDGAVFDREDVLDVSGMSCMITWGTSPEHVIPVQGTVPDPRAALQADKQDAMAAALAYMGLEAGASIAGTPIDRVFIGSCTNARLSDLREAASLIQGRRVASRVAAWVVAGSEAVKRAAEAEGLDQIFRQAGFDWREPGCSMCVAANGETAAPGERVVSTSNRNFVGRQGPGVRTHLASPATAVACALAGAITDPGGL
jgi:3-isopropylmalate/(R)-2-methylmalate dehydratase large subunit